MKKTKVKDLSNQKIYKYFSSETKAKEEGESRILVAKITTPNSDRSKDHVYSKGADTTNFMKNPVVLFAHNYDSKPIAKCTGLKSTSDGIVATIEFTPKGLYDEADIIYEMYKGGFLNAWSIGFMPTDCEPNAEGGMDFKSWEMFEFSSVPVPDNPEALTIMRSKGIDVKKAIDEMRGKDLPDDFELKEEIEEGKEEAKEAEEEVVETKETEEIPVETKEADNQPADAPISDLTVGQLKDLLADVIVGKKNVENSLDKEAKGVVKKDVDEVLMLSDVLGCLSWVIWCFENDPDGDANQASVDKLNQALGIILSVVQMEATLEEKSFKLADIPKGKEYIKIVSKAGRTISSKHEGMLNDAVDHMNQAIEKVKGVTSTIANPNDPNDEVRDEDEKNIASHSIFEKLANSMKTQNQKTDLILRLQKQALNLKGGE